MSSALSVLTFNLFHAMSHAGGGHRRTRLLHLISLLKEMSFLPDVLLFQEVWKVSLRIVLPGNVQISLIKEHASGNAGEILQGSLGGNYLPVHMTTERYPFTSWGQTTFSAFPVTQTGAYFSPSGDRCAIRTELQTPYGIVHVYNVHLDGTQVQLAEVLQYVNHFSGDVPVIVGGDFNWDYLSSSAHRELVVSWGYKLLGCGATCTRYDSIDEHAPHMEALDFFLYRGFKRWHMSVEKVFDTPVKGMKLSDHCGVLLRLYRA